VSDSFEGLPSPKEDKYPEARIWQGGEMALSLEEVQNNWQWTTATWPMASPNRSHALIGAGFLAEGKVEGSGLGQGGVANN
jgi:hypothetical protein